MDPAHSDRHGSGSRAMRAADLRPLLDLESVPWSPPSTSSASDDDDKTREAFLEQVEERKRKAWEWHFQAAENEGSRSDAGSRGPGRESRRPAELSILLEMLIDFRGRYEFIVYSSTRGPKLSPWMLQEVTGVAFDGVCDWLGAYMSLAGPLDSVEREWMAATVATILANLEFCRRGSHETYLGLVYGVVDLVRESEGAARLCWGQLMEELERTARVEANESLFAKSYFFLRIFPSMAAQLGPSLADDRFLDLLLLLCERPFSRVEEVSKLAHQCLGLVFSHAPEGAMGGPLDGSEGTAGSVAHRYLTRSLDLYPRSTPYNHFALTVVSLAKRTDLGVDSALFFAEKLVEKAAELESIGDAIQSSSLRKLCFGLMNVVPLPALGGLLDLYERIYHTGHVYRGGPVYRDEGHVVQMRAKICEEMAIVLDANGDYFRKPDLAAWLQRLAASTHRQSNL